MIFWKQNYDRSFNLIPKDLTIYLKNIKNPFCKEKKKISTIEYQHYNEFDEMPMCDTIIDTIRQSQQIETKEINSVKFSLKALKIELRSKLETIKGTTFNNLKKMHKKDDPLDLFTALLHIAAEDQFYL